MKEEAIRSAVAEAVRQARVQNPLAGSITNNVTIDFVANAQLAVGGSAAMVYLRDEAEAMAQASASMYFNLGTMIPDLGESIPAAAKIMHEEGKPYVVDPVGLGIGAVRTQILHDLKPLKPTVVRGNATEIIGLAGLWGLEGDAAAAERVRGVDATDGVEEALEAAIAIARYTGGAVAVSGEEDLVTDGARIVRSSGGSGLMEKITGCGCSLGGVISVFVAVADPFIAALAGTALYNLAGERAQRLASGPASFKVEFLDELFNASPEDIAANPFVLMEV